MFRMKQRILQFVVLLSCIPWAFGQSSRPAADLIIRNAKIWTVDHSRPEAEAVAILGDRIVAVGSSTEIEAWRGPKTTVVNAEGKRLLPGFNDAHVHFKQGGEQLDNVQLNDAISAQEFVRRVAARAAKAAKDEWLTGGDWDETKWSPAQLPTKELIDPFTPHTPVAISRYDGHMILANSLALKLAGITAQTPDPAGGVIVRDQRGNPTGALKDAALDLLFKAVPPPNHDQRRHAIERALEHAASLGVTSVQHMNPDYADIAIYSELLDEGKLTTRIYAAPLITQVDDQVKIGIRNIVIPGARSVRIVVMMLTAPRIVPRPDSVRPKTHRSAPALGEKTTLLSGAYANQPKSAAPSGVRKPEIVIRPPKK